MEESLVKYWPQIIAAIAYIAWQAKHESDIINLKKRMESVEENNSANDIIIKQIAVDIAEMKTDIKWIINNRKL